MALYVARDWHMKNFLLDFFTIWWQTCSKNVYKKTLIKTVLIKCKKFEKNQLLATKKNHAKNIVLVGESNLSLLHDKREQNHWVN
jgi:hypothetical protein